MSIGAISSNYESNNNYKVNFNWFYGNGANKTEFLTAEGTTGNVGFRGGVTPVKTPKTTGVTETSWIQRATSAIARLSQSNKYDSVNRDIAFDSTIHRTKQMGIDPSGSTVCIA